MACEYCASRRSFLGFIVVGTAAVGLGAGCSGAESGAAGSLNDGALQAGALKDLSVGTLRAVPGSRIAVGRDAEGVYAMSLVCTHEGANMAQQGSISSSGITCALHGSRFDANGAVVQGPATRALTHFAVEIDASSNLVVHANTEVAASARTAVS